MATQLYPGERAKAPEPKFRRTVAPHPRETEMGSVMGAIPWLAEIMLPVAVLVALFLHSG